MTRLALLETFADQAWAEVAHAVSSLSSDQRNSLVRTLLTGDTQRLLTLPPHELDAAAALCLAALVEVVLRTERRRVGDDHDHDIESAD